MIEQNVLTNADLNMIWSAKLGVHPAIVSNVDSLLAKIAADLSDSQLDHLFNLFRSAWVAQEASRRDREQLLELVRRLAEDDRKGENFKSCWSRIFWSSNFLVVYFWTKISKFFKYSNLYELMMNENLGDMVDRVLEVLWQMTTAENISGEILNEAIHNMVKILELGSLGERERRRTAWLERIADQFKVSDASRNSIPVIKLFERIGNLFPETVHEEDYSSSGAFERKQVLSRLEQEQNLILHVVNELVEIKKDAASKYGVITEIQHRLQFIKYLLTEASIYLNVEHAVRIWKELVLNAEREQERELAFNWFKHLMGEESDLDQEATLTFFIEHILLLDTFSLSQSAIDCFSSFFSHIIQMKPTGQKRLKMNPTQEGLNYLWTALCSCDESIAHSIISIIQHHHHHLYHLNGDGNTNHNEFFDECAQS